MCKADGECENEKPVSWREYQVAYGAGRGMLFLQGSNHTSTPFRFDSDTFDVSRRATPLPTISVCWRSIYGF